MDSTEAALKKLSKEELTSECRKRNLPESGSTNEIIKRLTVAIEMAKSNQEEKNEPEEKRQKVEVEDDDSDDDIGPMRMFLQKQDKEEEKEETKEEELLPPPEKKALSKESFYLSDLPNSPMYEKSYTHPAHIQFTTVTPVTHYIYTGSINGTVKIWKKFPTGIEFVKRYDAHKGPLTSLVSSFDGLYVASVGEDQSIKVFDVNTFDLIRILKLDFTPGAATWVFNNSMMTPLLAVVNAVTHDILVYDIIESAVTYTFKYHKEPVVGLVYHTKSDYVISLDQAGVFNYWKPQDGRIPKEDLQYKFQVATDLYVFKKNHITPLSLSISKGCKWMGVFAKDWKFYILNPATGKLQRTFNESEEVYKELMASEELAIDAFHFNKKLKLEQLVRDSAEKGELKSTINCVFDDSETFVLYPCIMGLKIMHIESGECCCSMGEVENGERFLNVGLFQGIATVSSQMKMGLKKVRKNEDPTAEEDKTKEKRFDGQKQNVPDPSLFCTSFNKRRFYIFTRNEPDTSEEPRDVINEKEVAEDDILQEEGAAPTNFLAKRVTLRTTMGDIELELWGDKAPKAVENFSTHCKNGYYDGIIFHRVIKGFMIQGGDPSGSGYGGESIWKKPFEDEIHPSIKFDKPFLLAMANAGRCTNNSQFFITTVPTPWLDGKHTIFGKVLKGQSVVKDIERVRVQNDKNNRPFDDIKIVSTDVYMTYDCVFKKHGKQ